MYAARGGCPLAPRKPAFRFAIGTFNEPKKRNAGQLCKGRGSPAKNQSYQAQYRPARHFGPAAPQTTSNDVNPPRQPRTAARHGIPTGQPGRPATSRQRPRSPSRGTLASQKERPVPKTKAGEPVSNRTPAASPTRSYRTVNGRTATRVSPTKHLSSYSPGGRSTCEVPAKPPGFKDGPPGAGSRT